MQNIDVIITTWPNSMERVGYLRQTLQALFSNLSVQRRKLRYIVSSETDRREGWFGEECEEVCSEFGIMPLWREGPANLGAHLNFVYERCQSDLRFYCQDDWVLSKSLDITAGADVLEEDENVAIIRYWAAQVQYSEQGDTWARISEQSPWIVADNPALVHRRFIERCGAYKEGGDAGWHENNMVEQFRRTGLRAMSPVQIVQDASFFFKHIGCESAFPEKKQR